MSIRQLQVRGISERKVKPSIYITGGGIQVMLVNASDLHHFRRNSTMKTITDASALRTELHTTYYFSDIVLYIGDELTKIMKSSINGMGDYIKSDDLYNFIELLDHPSISRP